MRRHRCTSGDSDDRGKPYALTPRAAPQAPPFDLRSYHHVVPDEIFQCSRPPCEGGDDLPVVDRRVNTCILGQFDCKYTSKHACFRYLTTSLLCSQGGRNVLEITGLSSHVDTESPRIHGLGSDARVFDISCDTRLANAPGLRPKKHADAVKKLESNIKILDIERNVHRNEYDMLDQAVKSLANDTPAQMDAFMDRFVQRKLNAMTAVMKCEEAIESLNKELWLLNNASKGETAGRVIATILAKRPCTVTFQLTYRTSKRPPNVLCCVC